MQRQRTQVRLMDGHYEVVEEGYTDPEPIVHLFGRDAMLNHRHVRVEGFYPYFCAPMAEVLDQMDDLHDDHRVRAIETEDDGIAEQSYRGERLARVVTIAPWHVGELRESFTDYEADVRFIDRFQYDTGIEDAFSVPTSMLDGEDPIDVAGVEPCEPLDVPARICYLDIEVRQTDEGPSVVSERGRELADNRITAITTYDNYLDEYRTWVLEHPSWTATYDPDRADATVVYCDDERTLLRRFATYIDETRFDVLTAWNAEFDMPYLVNRYLSVGETAVYTLSPTRGVDDDGIDGSGRFMNGDIEGVLLVDLLTAYEKSQIHELDDSSLATVSAHETDLPKRDLDDIDEAWSSDVEAFVDYSIRDVESMVAIDRNRGVLAS